MPPRDFVRRIIPRAPLNNNLFARYGSAVLITSLAAVLTYILWFNLGSTISPLFFIGVLFVSWYGGLRPGLLSALLSAAACNLIFTQSPGHLAPSADDLLTLVAFMIGALFVDSLTMARHHAVTAALHA